ncbi:MAG: nucleotidyl transferase AbiEii/AbiGii toxin family protein [Wenzhouxiangella sp.]|jgi:hypothetical protein|nr:nucleotidyl transferase AbiEii/AbiGii toxin family protein [Wenzhouxiangella sp.]
MALEARYREQVRLLIALLPFVDAEPCFALKGGTAINFFVQPLPRLSVDIDLVFLPLLPRDEALQQSAAALQRMSLAMTERLPGTEVDFRHQRPDELRVLVRRGGVQVKLEVSPVLRGTLHPPQRRDVVDAVEQAFGFATVPVVSLPDLYGGKLCAALDRQHPRDLFDVALLLEEDGLNRGLFEGFMVYLLSHPRPMHEVLSPRWKPLDQVYSAEFAGMTTIEMPLARLDAVRRELPGRLGALLSSDDVRFLLSFKRGGPDWSLFPVPGIDRLPAVQWKLANIRKMQADKHRQSVALLEQSLDALLHRKPM